MASKKTPVEKLSSAIADALEQYKGSVQENLDIITKKMGQKGANALKQASKDSFDGKKYHKGWTYGFKKTKRYAKTTIYNTTPGLPHLLENGHVIKNGTGREYGEYPGKEHIKPIADELTENFVEEVVGKI